MVPHGLSSYVPIKVTMFAIQWGDHDCTEVTAPPGPGPYAGLSAEASNKMRCVSCTHDIISRICVYIYVCACVCVHVRVHIYIYLNVYIYN